MCTRIIPGSGNVCNRDSGGPAVSIAPNGDQTIVAVFAWGAGGCISPDAVMVWSSLAPVRNWIDQTIAANSA